MTRHTTEGLLPPMLAPKQAAAYANVDEKTIHRRIQDGTLPAVRFGPRCIRIRREDLLNLLTPVAPEGQPSSRPARFGSAALVSRPDVKKLANPAAQPQRTEPRPNMNGASDGTTR